MVDVVVIGKADQKKAEMDKNRTKMIRLCRLVEKKNRKRMLTDRKSHLVLGTYQNKYNPHRHAFDEISRQIESECLRVTKSQDQMVLSEMNRRGFEAGSYR